ncbi:hypothetical protein [Nonomuraea endophytica]|uniref:hypothetical protein n=1 Tax=Nonomuraea endophytica TaxID=714136 RepID=UPI0037CAFBDC
MAIDLESSLIKHVITDYNNWVSYGNGRGGLHAYTYCGWLFMQDRMEGAHIPGNWWLNPDIKYVCTHCVHALTCTLIAQKRPTKDHTTCEGCTAFDADTALGHPAKRVGA